MVLALEGVEQLHHERVVRVGHDATLRLDVVILVLAQQLAFIHHLDRVNVARVLLARQVHAAVGALADWFHQLEVLNRHGFGGSRAKTAKWLRVETLEETEAIAKELRVKQEKRANINALLA